VVRRGRGIAGVVALALVALIALVGTAIADNFVGTTSDDGYARVKTNERNVPELFVIRWRAACEADGVFYRSKKGFAGPYRHQNRAFFRDWTRTRNNNLDDGFSAVITSKYEGTRITRNRWAGVFQSWVIVKQDGQFFTRCRTGEISWSTFRR